MNRELQRQAIKNILKEMDENAKPTRELMVKAVEEDWDETKLVRAIVDATDLTKTFDYYTDRIMSVFSTSSNDTGAN